MQEDCIGSERLKIMVAEQNGRTITVRGMQMDGTTKRGQFVIIESEQIPCLIGAVDEGESN